MKRLTQEQLRSRLKFDYGIASAMENDVATIEAYGSAHDLNGRRDRITTVGDGARATHYRVEFGIKSLVAEGKFHDHFVVSIDLLANGNYPFSEPTSFVISQPLPWSPHIAPNLPICTGEMWHDLAGHATVGHLILHLSKLLNFDETERWPGYAGYNRQAVAYWKRTLKGRPITAGLGYPVLPAELTHDAPVSSAALFKAAGTETLGMLVKAGSATGVFRPFHKE